MIRLLFSFASVANIAMGVSTVATCLQTVGPYGANTDLTQVSNLPALEAQLTSDMTASSLTLCQQEVKVTSTLTTKRFSAFKMTLKDSNGNLLELEPIGITEGMKCLSFNFDEGDYVQSIEQQFS